MEGVVWFDRNEDGDRDEGEWPLPGVQLELVSQPTGGAQLRLAAAATSPVTAAAAEQVVRRTTTGPGGAYRFTDVPAGTYRVKAAVSKPGFEYTLDPDGLADWVASVRVAGGATTEADFAGLGKGTLSGDVFLSASRDGVARAAVTCRWAGFDDIMGNEDDVLMETTADDDGVFRLAQVPYGKFSCLGKDPVSGRESLASTSEVFSEEPVEAKLPLPEEAPAPAPVRARPAPQLVRTGSDTDDSVQMAVALLLAGLVLQVGGRRRRAG